MVVGRFSNEPPSSTCDAIYVEWAGRRPFSSKLRKAAVPYVVGAFRWTKLLEQLADCLLEFLDGALGGIAWQSFELREGQFDGVQVWLWVPWNRDPISEVIGVQTDWAPIQDPVSRPSDIDAASQ